MATYRVISQIECDDENLVRQLGQDYLDDIQGVLPHDHLSLYVEHEFGWMEQAFNRIDV